MAVILLRQMLHSESTGTVEFMLSAATLGWLLCYGYSYNGATAVLNRKAAKLEQEIC